MQQTETLNTKQETALFLAAHQPGYKVVSVAAQVKTDRMALEVAEGLSQAPNRSLPCTYFYDPYGSELYEQITRLPEYYPTRTEADILHQISHELGEIVTSEDPSLPQIVELGSGSSSKTRILLDAWHADREPITYIPIDVSESMLSETAHALTESYRNLSILGLAGQYEDALALLPPGHQRLFLFLGGTIGNFTPEFQNHFFKTLAQRMGVGAKLLIGFDRQPHARKPYTLIEQAYNDRQGVTSEFNINILTHINRRLGADFNLAHWRHEAIYNQALNQIELYLESTRQQTVHITELNQTFSFEAGERILTEISRKFDPDELANWFERLGFQRSAYWTDDNELFGVMLLTL